MMGNGSLDPSIVALLVNAVYFKGRWTYEFDPKDTVDGMFTKRGGSMAKARYMTAHRKMDVVPQAETLGKEKVLVLGYGKQASGANSEFSSILSHCP